MSDTTTAVPLPGPETDRTITVQPREIKEAAFRALCGAGADPLEAHEGALAVLRAEADAHAGLRLLQELLDANWTTPARPTTTKDIVWAGGTLREMDSAGQPPLRTALQLLDLATEAPADGTSAARASDTGIPGLLWNDLLLRRTATLQSRIIIATATPDATPEHRHATEYLTVQHGTLSATPTLASEAFTALIPETGKNSTVVMALPEPDHKTPDTTFIPPKPLKMREKEWQSMYQMSRKYLVPDA